MKTFFKLLIFLFLILSIVINLQVFKSLRVQRIILSDHRNPIFYTYDKLDSILPPIPNISITAMPLDVYRVNYLLAEGRIEETYPLVQRAMKVNPYTHIGDFLYGKIFYYKGQYDSAYFYSKRAFFGWPKNIDHYNSYVDVLEKLKDTTSLIKAYNFLKPNLKEDPDYFNRFYRSFNKIKLDYLITDYPDATNITTDLLEGKWSRVYNFPNNQVVIDSSTQYNFLSSSVVSNGEGDEFYYKIIKDTFYFYFKSNLKKPISKFKAQYSQKYESLLFENIPIENGLFQTQYFKKSE